LRLIAFTRADSDTGAASQTLVNVAGRGASESIVITADFTAAVFAKEYGE
jgi:hypothetical protein